MIHPDTGRSQCKRDAYTYDASLFSCPPDHLGEAAILSFSRTVFSATSSSFSSSLSSFRSPDAIKPLSSGMVVFSSSVTSRSRSFFSRLTIISIHLFSLYTLLYIFYHFDEAEKRGDSLSGI